MNNLDEQVAALAEPGVAPDETETLPEARRKAAIVDPEGTGSRVAASSFPPHWICEWRRQLDQTAYRRRRKIGPTGLRPAVGMKIAIQESLPSSQAIDGVFESQFPVGHRISELVQIQHAVVASVGRDNHVDIEVTKRVAIALHIDRDQVDVPRICAVRINLEY